MKIVQYLGGLDSGGAETMIKDYAIALKQRGHEVIIPVYYTTPESPNQVALENNNICIDIMRGRYSRNVVMRLYNKLLTITGANERYLKKLLIDEKPDVLHLHGYVLKDFKYIFKELEGIKILYTCHNPPKEFFDGKWKCQYEIAKRLIIENNMQLIALHREMANELNQLFGVTNTVTLNNPINVKRFQMPLVSKKEMRLQLNIPIDAFVIGHVGRFNEQKNHRFLIDVFAEVYKKNNKAFLLLIGAAGGDRLNDSIEKLDKLGLKEHYLILFDRSDMPELYSAMDVFAFPSLYEGLGIAFLEAQAANLKCVISDRISSAAIVSNNVFSLRLEDDINMWVDAFLKNDASVVELHNNISEYDIDNVIDKLLVLYQQNNG